MFDALKTRLLPYLQYNDTWLAQNKFPTLKIYAAGAFSLCHSHWKCLAPNHQLVQNLIQHSLSLINMTTLTPDQRDSLADDNIPPFELQTQSIRAHLPLEDEPPILADNSLPLPDSKPKAKTTSVEFIATDCLELKCKQHYTEFFCTALESTTLKNIWDVGRFFTHTLLFNNPLHHFVFVSEQHLFAKNTSYIQIQWAHPMVIHSQVLVHCVLAFATAFATQYNNAIVSPPPLKSLLLSLPGNLPNDPMHTQSFLSLEPTKFQGTWNLVCHSALLQDNCAWFDTHFVPLYQATTAYNSVGSADARYRSPYRCNDCYD